MTVIFALLVVTVFEFFVSTAAGAPEANVSIVVVMFELIFLMRSELFEPIVSTASALSGQIVSMESLVF